jgi:outer membrane protein OmpA-like peptidoglycan-associated protein
MSPLSVRSFAVVCMCLMCGCAGPQVGPDKQFVGTVEGAATGAGAGAVTGFQLSAGAGPGAAVGAGLGAVVGGIQGIIQDMQEEDMLRIAAETRQEREKAYVHEVLADHYKRRLELHPSRDIYPADLFFNGDEGKVKRSAVPLLKEIARLNKRRLPWSRLVIAAYAKSADSESEYGQTLCQLRARAIGDYLVANGIEPRRVQTRAVLLTEPLLIDPADSPTRYNQAIEIIPLDR